MPHHQCLDLTTFQEYESNIDVAIVLGWSQQPQSEHCITPQDKSMSSQMTQKHMQKTKKHFNSKYSRNRWIETAEPCRGKMQVVLNAFEKSLLSDFRPIKL